MRNQYEAAWSNHLRDVEHKKRSLEQERIDKQKAEEARRAGYRGPK